MKDYGKNMGYDTHTKSIKKSIIWRIMGIIILASVTYAYTRHWIQTGLITFIHHGIFLIVFYFHERVWLKCIWKLKYIFKAITYEIILGNLILGTITWLITGNWKKVTGITLTYIAIKLIIYPIYDYLWSKKKIVYAYVAGDLFHIGHLRALENAKKQGNYLIVGVLSRNAVKEKKKPPIIPLGERMRIVNALKCVDKVVKQNVYSPLGNVKRIRPDVLMESSEHKEQPANNFVRSYGGKVVITPYYKPQSTTLIKEKIKQKLS